MKNIILPLLFSLFFFPAIAQKNYKPGSIVLENGNAVKGFIDYRNWQINPYSISFKKEETDADETYTVKQLKSFKVDGFDDYVKAIVVKDMLPVDINRLEFEGIKNEVKDTVFLRTLIIGDKISLYDLVDKKPHYFIREAGKDEFEELMYRIMLKSSDRTQTIERNIFRDQLKRFAFDNTSLMDKIEQASYKENELEKIVRALNSSVNDMADTKVKRPYTSPFFAGAGLSHNKIAFSGTSGDLNVLGSKPYVGLVLEAGIDLTNKRGLQKLFYRFMLRYSNNVHKGEAIVDGALLFTKEKKQYELSMNMISPGVYVFYSIVRTEHGKLYVGGGGGYNFTTYTKNIYTTTNLTSGEVKEKDNYLKLGNWADVHLKLGYNFRNKFEINLDTRLDGTFTNNGLGSRSPSTFLTGSVRF